MHDRVAVNQEKGGTVHVRMYIHRCGMWHVKKILEKKLAYSFFFTCKKKRRICKRLTHGFYINLEQAMAHF